MGAVRSPHPDVAGSTETAARLGDRAWRTVIADHDRIVRGQLARYRGREVARTGDGFLATFDGPARGIRCASAIVSQLHELGLETRAGLHTGELELAGEDVRGIAVHVAARISAEKLFSVAQASGLGTQSPVL